MHILDRYILRRFLTSFIYVVGIVITILCVIDFTERSDEFIKNEVPFSEVFISYYLNYIPYIANMFSPISIFIATVFVTARMATHTEIIAMLSSGISFKRMMVPYVVGSSFVGIIIFLMIGWVIPSANQGRIAFENQYFNKKTPDKANIHIKIAPGTYAYMENYIISSNTGYHFTLESFDGNTLISKLKASKVIWQSQKQSWLVKDYSIRTFKGKNESLVKGSQLDTVLNLSPKDFAANYMLHETLTLTELNNYIIELQEKGAENIPMYLTEKYERYTYPFAIVILTVIGVIASARKTREGAGYPIAFGFLLAVIYIFFVFLSQSFSNVGSMGPLMASWLPNIIFGVIGYIMYRNVPK